MSLISGLEVTEYAPTEPMFDLDIGEPSIVELPDTKAAIAVCYPGHISDDFRAKVMHEFARKLPSRIIFVLDSGASVQAVPKPGQIDRIEQKLDALIKALAEDEEPEGTLDDPVGPLASSKMQGL